MKPGFSIKPTISSFLIIFCASNVFGYSLNTHVPKGLSEQPPSESDIATTRFTHEVEVPSCELSTFSNPDGTLLGSRITRSTDGGSGMTDKLCESCEASNLKEDGKKSSILDCPGFVVFTYPALYTISQPSVANSSNSGDAGEPELVFYLNPTRFPNFEISENAGDMDEENTPQLQLKSCEFLCTPSSSVFIPTCSRSDDSHHLNDSASTSYETDETTSSQNPNTPDSNSNSSDSLDGIISSHVPRDQIPASNDNTSKIKYEAPTQKTPNYESENKDIVIGKRSPWLEAECFTKYATPHIHPSINSPPFCCSKISPQLTCQQNFSPRQNENNGWNGWTETPCFYTPPDYIYRSNPCDQVCHEAYVLDPENEDCCEGADFYFDNQMSAKGRLMYRRTLREKLRADRLQQRKELRNYLDLLKCDFAASHGCTRCNCCGGDCLDY